MLLKCESTVVMGSNYSWVSTGAAAHSAVLPIPGGAHIHGWTLGSPSWRGLWQGLELDEL